VLVYVRVPLAATAAMATAVAAAAAAAAAGAITLHGCTSQHIASFVLDEFFDLVSVSILYLEM